MRFWILGIMKGFNICRTAMKMDHFCLLNLWRGNVSSPTKHYCVTFNRDSFSKPLLEQKCFYLDSLIKRHCCMREVHTDLFEKCSPCCWTKAQNQIYLSLERGGSQTYYVTIEEELWSDSCEDSLSDTINVRYRLVHYNFLHQHHKSYTNLSLSYNMF